MKKVLSVFALAAVMASCSGVEDKPLDTACACAEATIGILTDAQNLYNRGRKEGGDWDESQQKKAMAEMKGFETKYSEVVAKMIELGTAQGAAEEGEECLETAEKMQALMMEMADNSKLNFPLPTGM